MRQYVSHADCRAAHHLDILAVHRNRLVSGCAIICAVGNHPGDRAVEQIKQRPT
jgi:hypothetical protein